MCTVFNIEKLIELKDGYKVAIYKVRLTSNYKRNRYCILDRNYEKYLNLCLLKLLELNWQC